MRKLSLLIITGLLLFGAFLYFYLRPHSYETKYEIKNYQITEKYFEKEKHYYFQVVNDGFIYEFVTEMLKYDSHWKRIVEIRDLKEEDYNCILPIIETISTYPLCYLGNEQVSFSLIESEKLNSLYSNKNTGAKEDYEGINISSYNDKIYLVWNYKGFYFMNDKTQKEIKLFKKDIYEIPLATMINNYLFIPNYDMEHTFKEAFLINLKSGTKELWKLDNEINFNSYILGTYENSIYLFDNKTKKEYEIVPHKKKMREVTKNNQGEIFIDGWQKISTNKLSTGENKFEYSRLYNYLLKDKKIYLSMANNQFIRISNLEDVEIIQIENNTVYYFKDAKVYSFNPFEGEMELMSYFEWNFNYKNMIFIFNNQK